MSSLAKKDFWWICLLGLLALACVARFLGLETAMPGFYIDESGTAANIFCLRQTGANAYGEILPMFSPVIHGGWMTAPIQYSGVLWTAIFGDSITSYRAMIGCYSLITIWGLYHLATLLFGDRRAGILVALACAVSPWSFQFSRIAWDSGTPAAFFVWACYFTLRAEKNWHAAAAGSLMAIAMYAYPPFRVHALLLSPLFFYLRYHQAPSRQTLKLGLIALMTGVVVGIPLIRMVLMDESFTSRAKMLSIFSDYYMVQFGGFSWTRALQTFSENMISMFRPSYLFVSGDSNIRHSTQSFGILGPLDIFAVTFSFVAFWMKPLNLREKQILVCLLLAYLSGLVPAALTWESNPHALRSFSAEPFAALLVGWALFRLWQKNSWFLPATTGIASVSLVALVYVHFAIFPERALAWFDSDLATYGKQKKTADEWQAFMDPKLEYPMIGRKYFLMAYGTGVCVQPDQPRVR